MKEQELTTGYPDPSSDNDEADETPQTADESVNAIPPGNMGATSPPDDDSQWDYPCGCKADPSPTR